ncbi:glucosamine-6-phosphate deaminase [Striga asiatica]|uniref:Glucosamine-6-phosphate deaminase n=1 Tax=Striga asiatica TaxID=4170 RepID=A0A5A7Q3F8_STRAF|nr:glucosamine-6-phosphate deaminase [Striga asiatica]
MIFGKKEPNKVSAEQVFILSLITNDKPVTMLQYLKESLYDICNDTRRGPTLGHVVTKLADHFGVPVDEPKYLAKWFSERDLHHDDFLDDNTHARHVYKWKAYEAYCKANGLPWPHPSIAGTSTGPDPVDTHNGDGDDDEANVHPADDTIQPLPLGDEYAGASSHSTAPAWFTEYEAQNKARWTSFVKANDEQWAEQTRQWNEFVQTNDAHWTAHDGRWDTWTNRQYQQIGGD